MGVGVYGLELNECKNEKKKKMDVMRLIKEDMPIFGLCPAHDEFYLVVCSHCSQVVKPQAFQKHCERRHGPLRKLYSRAQPPPHASNTSTPPKSRPCNNQPLNQTCSQSVACGHHSGPKSSREKPHSPAGSTEQHADQATKGQRDNLCLFVPVVNLEKIPNLSKLDGSSSEKNAKHAPLVSSISQPNNPKSTPTKLAAKPTPSPSAKTTSEPSVLLSNASSRKVEAVPSSVEPHQTAAKSGPKSYKKISRKECDLNRQCGVMDPETKRVCTRLLTCKIHSIHRRREVQGRAKDFDALVAELKASSRNKEAGVERSPSLKEGGSRLSSKEGGSQSLTTASCKRQLANCATLRSRISSESDHDDFRSALGEQPEAKLLYPLPLLRPDCRASSDESEGETTEEVEKLDCPYSQHLPRPAALCTFGSRLIGRGCYLFDRRLDHFCSALSSMLERHISSHMWKRIPPAVDFQPHSTSSPIGVSSSDSDIQRFGSQFASGTADGSMRTTASCILSSPVTKETKSSSYTAASPHAATTCGLLDSTGGNQSITSPLAANTPSPSFSKLPSSKTSKSAKVKESPSPEQDISARKRKRSMSSMEDNTVLKKNCILGSGRTNASIPRSTEPSAKSKTSLSFSVNGVVSPDSKMNKHSGHMGMQRDNSNFMKRTDLIDCHSKVVQADGRRASVGMSKGLQMNCVSREDVKKRKTGTSYPKPIKVPSAPLETNSLHKRKKSLLSSVSLAKKFCTMKPKSHS
ncbi:ataxin-7-like protein 2 isoform X2 [Protopterus annectens]|uniref:ataxin-7-like protein 2 isoform X2 n=1 Tax=Protopterus annectens TaxID=7888 RepID=UPI001CFB514E|nr:ataxin-7-like protein 2 isoform X2 [Protopterus annectens]